VRSGSMEAKGRDADGGGERCCCVGGVSEAADGDLTIKSLGKGFWGSR
jgi:hypothetical protein